MLDLLVSASGVFRLQVCAITPISECLAGELHVDLANKGYGHRKVKPNGPYTLKRVASHCFSQSQDWVVKRHKGSLVKGSRQRPKEGWERL